ncbi:MAG: hypothetical protein WBB01_07435 [Phormidesmis sp.]
MFYTARLIALWVAANFLGGFLVGFLENNGLQFAATIFLTGAIVGSLQWVVLRQVNSRMRWWPVATAIGWIMGVVLFASAPGQSLSSPVIAVLSAFGLWDWFWNSLVTTMVWIVGMAIAQALLLSRRRHFSGVWLLASLLGGAIQGVVSTGLCAAFCRDLSPTFAGAIVTGFGWAAYGIVTGAALWSLPQLSISKHSRRHG